MTEHDWLNPELYPFESRFAGTPSGRVHYLDEGNGPVVLMVHGTPTWSFLFRKIIRDLSRDHRVIAIDHLGFGLSDKPPDVPYRPEDHAARLTGVIEHLQLEDVTLLVHDFGGPIGLAHAIGHPEGVRGIVAMNTWLWSLEGTPAAKASRFFSTAVGRFLYKRLNFSPRVLLRAAFTDRGKLTREVHRHYLRPFPRPADRQATWELAKALRESGEWYDELWSRRDRLARKPLLFLWGMRDRFFGPEFLGRWTDAFPNGEVKRFAKAGHFVPEEVDTEILAESIRRHIARSRPRPSAPASPGESFQPEQRGAK